MKIGINNEILRDCAIDEINSLIITVKIKKIDPLAEEDLKGCLIENLNSLQMNAHLKATVWRKIYKEDFQVTEMHCSYSVDILLSKQELWNISNLEDHSHFSLVPMGGLELCKTSREIEIQYDFSALEKKSLFFTMYFNSKLETPQFSLSTPRCLVVALWAVSLCYGFFSLDFNEFFLMSLAIFFL